LLQGVHRVIGSSTLESVRRSAARSASRSFSEKLEVVENLRRVRTFKGVEGK
jgi:hypothetical protein